MTGDGGPGDPAPGAPVPPVPPAERRRLSVSRLRPRLVATFAVVAATTAVAVGLSSYALVRRSVLNAASATAVREARANLADAAARLPASPTTQEVRELNGLLARRGGFDVVVLAPGLQPETTSVALLADAVPPALAPLVERGRVASMRSVVGSRPYQVVGGRVQPDGPALYFFFPLADVARDLASLRSVLAATGATLVLVAGLVGAAAARGVLRPLGRARTAVRQVEVGLLSTRLPETGSDEFSDLAQSFNRMAAALERSIAEVRALESRHRQFTADVSHELRTPLTALTTAAGVLEGNVDGLNDHGRRAARLLVLESRRLARLVEDLMEISRLDAGVAPMRPELVDVAGLVGEVLRARAWEDAVETEREGDTRCAADPRRLGSIVANLVSNAIEHGAPPVRVSVTGTPAGVEVRVADSGQGIAPEYLPHVFERFYKGSADRPRSAGSGLGLAIAAENARLHGAELTVASEPGGGAVFTLRLLHPAGQAPVGQAGADQPAGPA